ncbi:MAG TPA: alpha/beta fold hydrolase [Opitutaceae bacterium]|nr:alpha/beta fold hydrolase [Opitutaceae bacterium]
MPVLDKPLSELRRYRGRNPRPADIDRYWDDALRELDATAPNPELIPNSTIDAPCECFDLWFTGVGGARIYAKYLRPRDAEKKHAALLQFHGYSASSGDWADKLGYVSAGFCVASMDCRGQGGRSRDVGGHHGNTLSGHFIRGLAASDPKQLLYRSIFLDTVQLARVVSSFSEVDEKRLGAFGGSQGGALTLACAALEPRIRLAAPLFPFLCDYQRVWEMDLAKGAYLELAEYFRRSDPRHEREKETFTKLGYIDIQHLAPRIRAEVLMFTGLMDAICPPSTQFAAYNKIRSKKRMVIYPDHGHEALPGEPDITFNFLRKLQR